MRKALLYSALLHVVIFLIIYFDLRFALFQRMDTSQTIVFDFVAISDKSAAPKRSVIPAPEETAKEEIKEEEKKEELKKQETPEPEKQKEPEKPKEQEKPKEPETKKDKEKPKEETVPLKKNKDKPKKEEKKKEEPKKKDKKTPKKAEIDLAKQKPKGTKEDAKDKKPKAKKKNIDDVLSKVTDDTDAIDALIGEEGADVDNLGPVVTASEIDAVRAKIRPCWSVPAGAKGAKDLVVDIDMELNADGTVIKADIVDKRRMANDPYYNVAAESAQRAVLDPKCNPLPLPKGKFSQWKNMTMSFNPKDMF